MKVIEIRNYCASYDDKVCREGADWAGLYIIKQILRMIQLKQLKNAVNEVELWIPDYIVKGVDKWTRQLSRNRGSGGSSGSKKSKKGK